MLSLRLRPVLKRVVDPVAAGLLGVGVGPDTVTVVGTLGVSAGALAFYPRGVFFWGTVVISLFVFNDMLDGAMARLRGGGGPWGSFLDSTLDRVADASVFTGLLWWFVGRGHQPGLAVATAVALIGGVVVSYARAKAESLGMRCDVGLVERAERLVIALTVTGLDGLGVPYVQATGLWVLAVGTVVTVAQRVAVVHRQARQAAQHAART